MKKEWVVVVIILVAVAGWWFFLRAPEEEQPKIKCPQTCAYGCIPGTAQCREAPPPVCPSYCRLGCIPNTTECKPEVPQPKAKGIDRCDIINETSELLADISSEESCLRVVSDDVTLDCKDHAITGSMKMNTYGIGMEGRKNVTLKNCVIRNFEYGVYITNSSNISLFNLETSRNRDAGISMVSSQDASIEGVKASANRFGVEITASNNIKLLNSLIADSPFGVVLHSSKDLVIQDNEVCSSITGFQCFNSEIKTESNNMCYGSVGCAINCSPCNLSYTSE